MHVCPKCNAVYEGEVKFCKVDGTPVIPLTSETHIPLGVTVNESLRVAERLRTDRFGVVYRVDDTIDTGQSYALRLFRRGLVNTRVFEALGKLAERLRESLTEPDILADYIPIQLEDGRYALLATDFPGIALDQIILNEAPLTPTFVVGILLRIADVLAGAHRSGLVHGNITPENVLVVDRSDRGAAIKLADFGVASTIRKHNARALTAPLQNRRLQTYDNYFAPELVTGRGVVASERTDIFSLGALCYQMLSGWIPFSEAAIEGDTSAVYLTEDPRPLLVLNEELGIPRGLEQAMLKALEVDPTARHRSLGELIEVLQEIEFDLSIMPPPGAKTDGSKMRQRRASAPTGRPAPQRLARTSAVGGRQTDPLGPDGRQATTGDVGETDDEPDRPGRHGD